MRHVCKYFDKLFTKLKNYKSHFQFEASESMPKAGNLLDDIIFSHEFQGSKHRYYLRQIDAILNAFVDEKVNVAPSEILLRKFIKHNG